jgi:hypothetical protein
MPMFEQQKIVHALKIASTATGRKIIHPQIIYPSLYISGSVVLIFTVTMQSERYDKINLYLRVRYDGHRGM